MAVEIVFHFKNLPVVSTVRKHHYQLRLLRQRARTNTPRSPVSPRLTPGASRWRWPNSPAEGKKKSPFSAALSCPSGDSRRWPEKSIHGWSKGIGGMSVGIYDRRSYRRWGLSLPLSYSLIQHYGLTGYVCCFPPPPPPLLHSLCSPCLAGLLELSIRPRSRLRLRLPIMAICVAYRGREEGGSFWVHDSNCDSNCVTVGLGRNELCMYVARPVGM